MPKPAPLAQARIWLLSIVLLVCVLGGNAPPGPHSGTGEPSDPAAFSLTCPAPDPAKSPFPAELSPADTAPAGTLPGSFAVSRLGDATYSIPLVVPPGRAGMEPNLAVTYNSSAGEGF